MTSLNLRKKKIKATSSKCLSNDQVNLSKQSRANTLSSFKTRQTKVHCAPSTAQFVSADLQHEDNKHTLSYNKDLQPTVRSVLPSLCLKCLNNHLKYVGVKLNTDTNNEFCRMATHYKTNNNLLNNTHKDTITHNIQEGFYLTFPSTLGIY